MNTHSTKGQTPCNLMICIIINIYLKRPTISCRYLRAITHYLHICLFRFVRPSWANDDWEKDSIKCFIGSSCERTLSFVINENGHLPRNVPHMAKLFSIALSKPHKYTMAGSPGARAPTKSKIKPKGFLLKRVVNRLSGVQIKKAVVQGTFTRPPVFDSDIILNVSVHFSCYFDSY